MIFEHDIAVIGAGMAGASIAPIWLLEIAGTLGFVGLCGAALWNLQRVWRGNRGWFAKLWSVLLVPAALLTLWVTLSFHLISFGTRY